MVNAKNDVSLKDVAIMTLDEVRIEVIKQRFSAGEATKQEAFSMLVDSNIEALRPYVEAKQNGSLSIVRGASARLRKLLEATALNQRDLATSYLQPSVQLAKANLEGENSEAYAYVIENIVEVMDPARGDISEAPLFTPARLNAAGKALTKKGNDSLFEVDADDGLLLKGRRFGSYTIEEIKLTVRTGSPDPEALDMLMMFVGMDQEDNDGKEKLGTLGGFIKKVRDSFEGVEGSEYALEAVEALEACMWEVRGSLVQEKRLSTAIKQAEADRARVARKLRKNAKREESVIANRETVKGQPVTVDTTPED